MVTRLPADQDVEEFIGDLTGWLDACGGFPTWVDWIVMKPSRLEAFSNGVIAYTFLQRLIVSRRGVDSNWPLSEDIL